MAAGTPVIASAVSGIPELVEHEVNGLLVAPEDPEALADTLLRLHGDPALSRDARAQRARDGRAPLRRRPAGEPAGGALPGGGPGMTSAVARRPRPVLCVTEHEHRSRAIADGVPPGASRSRARRARSAPSRTGTAPTSRRRGVADRVGQVRAGGSTSPTPATSGSWEELTASWIRRCAPDEDAAEVTARRVLNWIYAWQRFDVGDDHAERLLAQPRATRSQHVRGNLAPARNHRTLELYALLIAGARVPGARRRPARVRRRRARPQPRRGLPRRRRPPRGLDALPRDRAALVRRRARERRAATGSSCPPASTSASRAPARSWRTARARRDDPGALGRRHRRLLRAARAAGDPSRARPQRRASPTAATTCSAAAGTPTRAS